MTQAEFSSSDVPIVLPDAILQRLDAQAVKYELCHTNPCLETTNSQFVSHIPLSEIVHLIVLQDSLGKIQLLIGEEQLLDLSQLCEVMGRNLQGLAPEDAAHLKQQQGLDSSSHFASIPLKSIPDCWIDQKLLTQGTLYLHSGIPSVFIVLHKTEAEKLIKTCKVSQFCHNTRSLHEIARSEPGEQQITQAVSKFTSFRIKQRLDQTIEIPPLPETAQRITKLRADPEASIQDLAKVVETDPSLAAQVVSWASSPFYGAPGGIVSVQDAVIRVLGFDLVINLALGLALGKTLRLPQDGPRGLAPYWQQAVYSATLTQSLVQKMDLDKKPSPGLAYLSGLLKNFGYLILSFIFPPHFSLISRYIEANPHISHHIIDQHVLGVTREQISSWLMNVWQIPEEVAVAIRWQMFPEYDGKHAQYARLLYITDKLLKTNGTDLDPINQIPLSLYEQMGLDPNKVLSSLEHLHDHTEELQEIAKLLA